MTYANGEFHTKIMCRKLELNPSNNIRANIACWKEIERLTCAFWPPPLVESAADPGGILPQGPPASRTALLVNFHDFELYEKGSKVQHRAMAAPLRPWIHTF
jgi:hypothetical protein